MFACFFVHYFLLSGQVFSSHLCTISFGILHRNSLLLMYWCKSLFDVPLFILVSVHYFIVVAFVVWFYFWNFLDFLWVQQWIKGLISPHQRAPQASGPPVTGDRTAEGLPWTSGGRNAGTCRYLMCCPRKGNRGQRKDLVTLKWGEVDEVLRVVF